MSGAEKTAAETNIYRFVIGGINCSLDQNEGEAFELAAKRLKGAGIDPAQIHFKLCKKSSCYGSAINALFQWRVKVF